MKKILSVLLALVMTLSLFALSGCKKDGESMTDVELFKSALGRLSSPKMLDVLTDSKLAKNANHTSFSLDKLDLSLPMNFGEDSENAFPEIGLDLYKFVEDSFSLSGDVKLDGEELGANFELRDGEKFYLSVPDATDRYLTGTIDELSDLMVGASLDMAREDDEFGGAVSAPNNIYASLSALVEVIDDAEKLVFGDDNISRSEKEVEVFGESLKLDCLTLTLDENIAQKLIEVFADALGYDEADEKISELIEDEGISFDLTIALYLDGEDPRRCEMSLDGTVDGDRGSGSFGVSFEADVENSLKIFKNEGEMSLSVDGDEVVGAKFGCALELDGKNITGDASFVPSFEADLSDEYAALAEDLELSAEIDGTLEHDTFDIGVKCELSLGSFAIKLPMNIGGTFDKDHLSTEFEISASFMGAGFELKASTLTEKADVEPVEYDPALAVEIGDEDALREFCEDVSGYVENLESISAFAASLFDSAETLPSDGDFDDDYYYYDDYDDDFYYDDFYDDDFDYDYDDDFDFDLDYDLDYDDFYFNNSYDDFADFDFSNFSGIGNLT